MWNGEKKKKKSLKLENTGQNKRVSILINSELIMQKKKNPLMPIHRHQRTCQLIAYGAQKMDPSETSWLESLSGN